MNRPRSIKRLLLAVNLLVIALAICPPAWAQTTGTILGVVTDPAGAAIPNAKVALSNPATGLSRTTATNSSGQFVITLLPPSDYDIEVEAAGFEVLSFTTHNPAHYQPGLFPGFRNTLYPTLDSLFSRYDMGINIECIARKRRSSR